MSKVIIILILLFFSCAIQSMKDSREQPGKEYCGQVCDKLVYYNCDLGKTVNGKNCFQKCYEQQEQGYFWNTYCLINITSCNGVNECKSIYEE